MSFKTVHHFGSRYIIKIISDKKWHVGFIFFDNLSRRVMKFFPNHDPIDGGVILDTYKPEDARWLEACIRAGKIVPEPKQLKYRLW